MTGLFAFYEGLRYKWSSEITPKTMGTRENEFLSLEKL